MSEPLLSVRDLSVSFHGARRAQALSNIDLDLMPGQVLGLLGESGSGKSVTLRTLLRLHPASTTRISGSIRVAGQDVLSLKPGALDAYRGKVASMVFQEPGLAFDPVYTIGQQIAECLRVHKGSDRRAAQAEALRMLERVQIPQARRRLDAYPHELSGGMRQRIAIARTLAFQPRILLMDEPFAALDEITRADMRYLLLDVWERTAATCVFVTHSIDEAVILSDRVVVLAPRPGRIVAIEPIDLPRPRTAALEDDPAFHAHVSAVRTALRGRST